MYCKRDVVAMRQVAQKLPRAYLLPREQEIWELTYKMNTEGLPIDYQSIFSIYSRLNKQSDKVLKKIPELSEGFFETMGQLQKVRDWCAYKGYEMSSLDAATVQAAIDDPKCPDVVKNMLELRQQMGRSSTAKYTKFLDLATKHGENDYRIHDNLVYHGAGPGRWAARGVQMHNFPRASVESPEDYISCFNVEDGFGDESTWVAKALLRPMISAREDELLIVFDYSSIENYLLHWHANDVVTLQAMANGLDQYKDMAATRYNVEYAKVTKPQRFFGKVIVLGCGYQMGKDKFKETAKLQFGLDVSIEESGLAVNAYRQKYPEVVALWNGLKNAAARTVMTGKNTSYNRITFGLAKINDIIWLAMKLPSGKCVYYMSPEIHHLHIENYEHMGRVPTITHMGVDPYSKRWTRLKLTPGRITENAVQGTAREIMAQGMLNVQNRMPEIRQAGTVHDEDIGKIRKADLRDNTIRRFSENLCDIPWLDGLKIKGECWVGKRYRK